MTSSAAAPLRDFEHRPVLGGGVPAGAREQGPGHTHVAVPCFSGPTEPCPC